jgi:hypothetical protein
VPYEQTLAGRLRERDSTALGVGVEGSGPLVHLGIVREYLVPLRPALVVWVFFEGNDLRDLNREAASSVLLRYLEPDFSQNLRALRPDLDQELRAHIDDLRQTEASRVETQAAQRESALRRRNSLAGWVRLTELRHRFREFGKSRTVDHPYDSDLFTRTASRMRDDVKHWGGTLIFAYLPSQRRFADPSTANPHRTAILDQVVALGIPVIDLYEPMAAHRDPLSLFPFRVESHVAAEGYDLIARALDAAIQPLRSGDEDE